MPLRRVKNVVARLRSSYRSHSSPEFQFRRTLARGEPYFGSVMAALQGNPRRHWYMDALVGLACAQRDFRPLKILEIGSWAGGSAVTWAGAIKKYNRGQGLVWCVDPWMPYADTDLERPGPYRTMQHALQTGQIMELFLHNIRATGHEDVVRCLRGTSDEVLPMLEADQFDLIFVDGVHTYDQVLKDIRFSARLLCAGGILCGDDLELQAAQIDFRSITDDLGFEYIVAPDTNTYFHPGVTLAVAEYFGEVSVWEGFWAMRKADDGREWSKITAPEFKASDVTLLPHLQDR